jgi:hypothetical protein
MVVNHKKVEVVEILPDRVIVNEMMITDGSGIDILMGISKPHNVKLGDIGILSYHNGLWFYSPVNKEAL